MQTSFHDWIRRSFHILSLVLAIVGPTVGNVVAKDIVTGTDSGATAHVKVFDGSSGAETASFLPYGGSFAGGVRVATGDVNGDGTADIVTGAGPGAGSHVKAFSGINQSELASFLAYPGAFTGGVYVAAGDLNGDTFDDIITGAGTAGATHVKVFNSVDGSELQSFLAYPSVNADVRVAAGDVNGDGRDDIITSLGDGLASHVKVFDGTNINNLLHSFFAYGGGFTGGVYVAAGDVNGDSFDDIITGAGTGGGTHVKVFSGVSGSELHSFFAYPGVNNEARVGAGDVNGDGIDDIITGLGPDALSHVKAFSGTNLDLLQSFFAYGTSFTGGVYVAGVPADPIPEPATFLLAAMAAIMLAQRSLAKSMRPR